METTLERTAEHAAEHIAERAATESSGLALKLLERSTHVGAQDAGGLRGKLRCGVQAAARGQGAGGGGQGAEAEEAEAERLRIEAVDTMIATATEDVKEEAAKYYEWLYAPKQDNPNYVDAEVDKALEPLRRTSRSSASCGPTTRGCSGRPTARSSRRRLQHVRLRHANRAHQREKREEDVSFMR